MIQWNGFENFMILLYVAFVDFSMPISILYVQKFKKKGLFVFYFNFFLFSFVIVLLNKLQCVASLSDTTISINAFHLFLSIHP